MAVLSTCVFVYHLSAWYLGMPEEGNNMLELQLQMIVSHPGSREKKPVLSTGEPPLRFCHHGKHFVPQLDCF